MARKPRIHFPGALYHVMLRGNDGQNIFFNAKDREVFNNLVQEGVKRYGHVIYAFCLMSNHDHLAIEVSQHSLSKIIQNISFRYTRYINKKLKRIGHLFQGRYKALLVEKEPYLLELIRYIHLNPVRSKLVKKPEDYSWSGHRCYLGKDEVWWLGTQSGLKLFSSNKSIAIKRYARFIEEGINDEEGIAFEKGSSDPRVIGNEEFVEEVTAEEKVEEIFNLDLITKMVCKIFNVSKSILSQKTKKQDIAFARYILAYLNKHYGKTPNSKVALMFNLDPSTLSRGVTKIEVGKDSKTLKKIEEILQLCRNT